MHQSPKAYSKIKTELDDLALKYSQPEVFFDLVNQINARKTEREEFVDQIVQEVSTHMKNANIKCEVNGRVKHFFSIYKKMVNQDKTSIRSTICLQFVFLLIQ